MPGVAHRVLVPLSPQELAVLLQRRAELLDADAREAVRQAVAEADPELREELVRSLARTIETGGPRGQDRPPSTYPTMITMLSL
jgi:hypothetical protein